MRAHPRLVIGGWLAAVIVAMAAAHAAGTRYGNNLSLPGTDSQRAAELLQREFPAQAGDADQIVFHVRTGTIDASAVRTRVAGVLARVERLAHVTGVLSPYSVHGAGDVSADRTTGFAVVTFDQSATALPTSATDRVIAVARSAGTSELQVELGGRAIEEANRPSLGAATAIGLAAALVVLLLTFGSAVAAGLPIITALFGLGAGLGLLGLGSHLLDTPDFASQLAALIGLGVGIDYALFIVTRFREEYRSGGDLDGAIDIAMDTAGRAVLFAGATVIIALLGLFILGITLLEAAALAAVVTVGLVMAAALTVLPVLLSRFGPRITAERPRRLRTASTARPFWPRWGAAVTRHPWRALAAGLAIMIGLSIPAFSLRLGQSDAGNHPTSQTTRRAYDLLATGFGPGFNGPLEIVAQLPESGDRDATTRIAAVLRATSGVASVSPPVTSPSGATAVLEATPATAPESRATTNLVNRIREQQLPLLERSTGSRILVGGPTATGIDFSQVVSNRLGLFIAVVIGLSALLLVLLFRSIVIPIQAAAMNLLSFAAALGVTVAVFQNGWLGGLLGVRAGPIEAFIPVFLFAIVFGLSMDYEVFLVSRIHEAWLRRRDSDAALIDGLGSTGRVVTAAATIMVCVFLSFVLGDMRIVKLFGLSLATAVFLDAFVVRSLLLPAVLTLFGERTWKLPKVLDRRLPQIAIERPAAEDAA
jgi:RND superfamily putative drug exporter